MNNNKSYKRLIIWQKANELALLVYKITQKFPDDEKFGLTSQLRRAALSVVLNIVEGYARKTPGDFRRFLDIALGSLSETEYLIELSLELEYVLDTEFRDLEKIRAECGRLLWSYRKRII